MPKRTKIISLLSLIFLAIFAASVLFIAFVFEFLNDGPLAAPKTVVIESGSGTTKIAKTLEDEGVINNALTFRFAAWLLDHHEDLKAGEYEFAASTSGMDALEKLYKGEVVLRKVTIREGLTVHQVIQIVNNVEALSGEITEVPKEGTLLPETYTYQSKGDRQALVEEMHAALEKVLDAAWEKKAEDLPFETKEGALTLASIIEMETAVPDERRRVAGVFINRLKKNMPLQTDPTVIYALTDGKPQNEGKGPLGRRLLSKDLKFDSPYNTYLYPGLPPGPIANPGQASIEAALNHEEHDFLYFVADGSGGHAFAKTLKEHNENVAKWRKHRRERAQ